MKIMKAARDAEFEKLVVASEPLSKREQKQLKKSQTKNTSVQQSQAQKTQPDYSYKQTVGEIPSEE